jgi:cobalt-zinc-cadmium efflux system membrane fusion protein
MKKLYSQPILLAAVMGIAVGVAYWAMQNFHAAPAEAAVEATAARHETADTVRFAPDAPQLSFVRVMPAEAYPEPLIDSLNARIAYDDNHTARVFSPIAGRVTKIAAEAGQYVKAGTPLLWIDSPDYGSGASDLLKAEADLSHKKETYERSKQLYEAKGLALKDLEQAEADWRQAVAEAERARARMKNLGAHAVENAAGQYVLRAPIDGIISERQVNAGSEVRPDATNSLFVITNPNHVWVTADLPEQQIGKIKVGQPVAVEVDAYPGETFPGKVSVISETLDPNLRRLQVRCDVDNSQHKLKPEMYARISPIASNNEKRPRVPNTAIFTEGLYSYIFVEQSPGVLQRRRVRLGMQDADFSFIREGLKAGERIVTSGALLLNSELNGNE